MDRQPRAPQQLTVPLLMALALLSASAPFSVDMYLPAFPAIVEDLQTTQSMVQLTLSGFLAGLALGQLLIGPLSDALGRHRLMLLGTAVACVAAVLAALAPTIGMLIAARLVQGLGSGAAIVLSRAVIPDLATGDRAARAFALLMTIQGVAPVLAPVVGGLLADPLGWRGLFWILAGLAAVQLLVVVGAIRESRPPEERSPATVRGILDNYRFVLASRGYRGYLVSFTFGFTTMFCYISASPFLMQEELGMSPQVYALVFAFNGVGIIGGSMLNARLIGRFPTHRILLTGLGVQVVTAALLVPTVLFHPTAWLILPLLFLGVSQISIIMGNSTALGTGLVRARAGSASALMGFTQFGVAGLVSPLMGLGGNPGLTMAVGMVACSLVATAGALYAGRATAAPTSAS
ncbi:major facilitator superfamily permease [Corynebacterium humireducens NBRC 106098 = DSM 45392]|uniref:Major facilitator superfamily permease n=1 Tax=Corynebacterium humireducens NBRC 106098 = DSM 45392 TaxID=1223515 RepID=A0A0B5DD33_9CORY|nr:multidrug effflux MFS transporter [Corynebacterium humireducens]AJE34138.1 major facilitator superfamily permease [Corynebacterium humireducens NBRC 106098 = DSM 45392]